jgi:hypothetical protein
VIVSADLADLVETLRRVRKSASLPLAVFDALKRLDNVPLAEIRQLVPPALGSFDLLPVDTDEGPEVA